MYRETDIERERVQRDRHRKRESVYRETDIEKERAYTERQT